MRPVLLGATEKRPIRARSDMAASASPDPVVQAADEAAVCGALGCLEGQPLYRVRHPEKGERVACEEHARSLAGEVTDTRSVASFKSSECDVSASTEILTPAATRSGSEDGMEARPRCSQAMRATMRASDTTPSEGESADGEWSDEQEAVAAALSMYLPRIEEDVRLSMFGVMDELDDGYLTHNALGELRSVSEELQVLVEVAEIVAEAHVDEEVKSEPADGGATTE